MTWPQAEAWDGLMYDAPFEDRELECRASLYECPLCFALTLWGNSDDHKQWHLGLGG